ncbi:MAG: hypothetical protein HYV07_28065 [Deltaproteobacteria bacterium]|nr:hypothetical protein [Deltaproteobacteria bacterium]
MKKTALLLGFLTACGSGEISGRLADPAGPTGSTTHGLFNADALSAYSVRERAYVMGHAYGVFLYSQTLPAFVQAAGYEYRPGFSSQNAKVPYVFDEVVVPASERPTVLIDENTRAEAWALLEDFPNDECYLSEWGETRCPKQDPVPTAPDLSTSDPSVPSDSGNAPDPSSVPDLPGTDVPPGADVPGSDDPAADTTPGEDEPEPTSRWRPRDPSDGEDDGPGSPRLDDDCESFLDPAAMDARVIGRGTDPEEALGEAMPDADAAANVETFMAALTASLNVEDMDEETDESEPEEVKPDVREAGLCRHSPIVLDLLGDGVQAGEPEVPFDLRETGEKVLTAWPSKDDALLVLDRNSDGKITNGGELFGTSKKGASRHADGFAALSELDTNHDGSIDARDGAFGELALWRDSNRDGVTGKAELTSLTANGIESLGLTSTRRTDVDRSGNLLSLTSTFQRKTPSGHIEIGQSVDVWFRIRALPITVAARD